MKMMPSKNMLNKIFATAIVSTLEKIETTIMSPKKSIIAVIKKRQIGWTDMIWGEETEWSVTPIYQIPRVGFHWMVGGIEHVVVIKAEKLKIIEKLPDWERAVSRMGGRVPAKKK
jgi:hypothetical protein